MDISLFCAENHGIFCFSAYDHAVFYGAPDVAIDLGSANTRLFAAGRGLLAETPSIIGGAFHPLRRGVVADVGGVVALLEPLIGRVRRLAMRPRALACIPSGASADERKALQQATRAAGAREVAILSEPLAAAVGANLDLSSGYGQMLIDLGDGVTDIAIVRGGQVIHNATFHSGCSDLRGALLTHLEHHRGVQVAEHDAERLVREACSLPTDTACSWMSVRNGSQTLPVGSDDVLGVIEPVLDRIADFVGDFVRDLPNNLAVEVIESGACITGGGAKLVTLVDLLRVRSGLTIRVAADPLHAVIHGAGRILTGRGAKTLWS
jgi:rod shape-determining protein MreB and related proteins